MQKKMGRGYKADPDYYHEGQTGRIFLLFFACQRPDAKYLGDGVRDQFGFRVALGSMSASGYPMMLAVLIKQFKEKILPDAWKQVNTGNGVVTEFYAPYVAPEYDFLQTVADL